MKSLRVTGVYSSDIILQLQKQNIKDIGFDIRPRSFNFIQLDQLHKILTEVGGSNFNIFLRFENDKDFVVRETVNKVLSTGIVPGKNLWVEYWGDENRQFCDDIGFPYVKLLKDKDYSDWLRSSKLDGFIINETFLNSLGIQRDMLSYLGTFFDAINADLRVDLSLDWNSEISKSLIEFYPFSSLCFQIDSHVETSYRNVNLHLIHQHIEHTKQLLTEI